MQTQSVKARVIKSIAFAGAALLAAACASSSSSQQQPAPNKQPATQSPQPSQMPTNSQTPSGSSTAGTVFPALTSANSPILVNGQTSTSLVNIVKASGKTLGVFEFVGVTCESCKTESPMVAQQLAPYASSITRFVVFPNQANQYTAAEYQGFVNSYSQGAQYAVDNDLSLLKSVRAKSIQYFGIYIIVKADGTGTVLNQDDAVNYVLPTVKSALGK